MGRLLDIARAVPETPPAAQTAEQVRQQEQIRQQEQNVCHSEGVQDSQTPCCAVSAKSAVSQTEGYSRTASDVLALLARADAPVPHTAIVRALVAAGYDKATARQGIADCQRQGWIEHDLKTGYVLSAGE